MIEPLISETLEDFCLEFVKRPYLSYTEHGIHAQYYRSLLEAIPETERSLEVAERPSVSCKKSIQPEQTWASRRGRTGIFP